MRALIEKTNGLVINEEEFDSEVYEKCLQKYFETISSDQAIYNATMQIFCSKELYISGMLGPGQLFEKSKDFPKDAENCFGETGGSKFQINSPINTSTFLFFFSLKDAVIGVK